ncbi:MAG: Xaa-Pro peptidase family protein [Pseudomonadota bacterium]
MSKLADRRRRAANIAREAGLAALAVVPGANLFYLSGLHFHLNERPTLMVITASGDVAAIMPELERSKWSAAFPEAETFYWQDSDGYDAAFRACAQLLDGPLGVEGMRMRMFESDAMAAHLPQGGVVNADSQLASLRISKDADEVAALRKAIAISEAALGELIDGAREGDIEAALVARLKAALLHHGAEGFSFNPLILSGPNAADCHGTPSDRAVCAGETLLIDFGATYGGMNADITRTFFCQHVPDDAHAIHETVRAANAHGKGIASPGVTCDALDRGTTGILQASPFARLIVHKTGHGLGLDVHEAPQVMVGNQTPLAPGMVVTIEPGLYQPGHLGVRIEDDVLITPDGCESLTAFPREAECFG